MNTKKRPFAAKLILVLLLTVYFVSLFALEARADMFSKPSITLTVENGASHYYIALLGLENQPKPDSVLICKDPDMETVTEYLTDFSIEDWQFFRSPVGTNVYESTEEGIYQFTYMVPNPFRVVVILDSGSVLISDVLSQHKYNANCTFDFKTGTLTEDFPSNASYLRMVRVLFCFLITLLIEFLILKLFRYPTNGRNMSAFLCVNFITQFAVNITSTRANSEPGFFISYIILEVLIILIEAVVYAFVLKDKEEKRRIFKNILYAISANVASALIGLLIHILLIRLQ